MSFISYYTAGPMLKTDIDDVTSEGNPMENINDFNPDSYWVKSTSDTQYLIFDKNDSTTTIDALVLFLSNYTSVSGNVTLQMDTSYTPGTPFTMPSPTTKINAVTLVDTATPIRIYDFASSGAERYWRMFLSNIAINVGMFLLCKKWTVSQGREFPINDTDQYPNTILGAAGGRRFSILNNQNASGLFIDTFQISGATNFNALKNAFNDCKGTGLPVIRQPGTAQSEACLCTFEADNFAYAEQDFQFYRPTVVLRRTPYINDGETY